MFKVDNHETRSLLTPEMLKQGCDYQLVSLSKGDVLIEGIKPDMVTQEQIDLIEEEMYINSTVIPVVKKKDNLQVRNFKNEVQDEFFNNLISEEEETFDEFLIELKRKDLLDKTGHRAEQAWRLSAGSYTSVLMFEGGLYQLCKQTRTNYNQAVGVITSAIMKRACAGLKGTISVINTESISGTVQYLKKFHDYMNNPYKCVRRLKIVKDYTKGNIQQAMKANVSTFPGIDDKRSVDILKRFGGFDGIYHAKIEDFQTIDGIGPKTAQKIFSFLHETKWL